VSEWWELPYKGGKMIELPGFPRPMLPPDAAEQGETPSTNGVDVLAYKRTVARLGRWKWDPTAWDQSYSNVFAHGESGGNVGESGMAGVQRQAKIDPATGWVDEHLFNLLRSVKIPEGLPHAGEHAMDGVARELLIDAWEATIAQEQAVTAAEDAGGSLESLACTLAASAPHWGGSNDVMQQFIEPFLIRLGMPLGSGKRTPEVNAAVGGSATSDHLTTKTSTAARDFPTFAGEDAARALAAALGFDAWQPNSFANCTFTAGGHTWRAQILWGSGIGHGDHIHVGVSPG